MLFQRKEIGAGEFVLYRQKKDNASAMTPARLQSPYGLVIALADVTGISNSCGKPKIICGAVKWHDLKLLHLVFVSEQSLLSAPTVEGAR